MKRSFRSGLYTSLILIVFLIFFFPYFLSYEKKVPANALVVEGWMPDYGLQAAYNEFQEGNYNYVFFTGDKFPDFVSLYVNSFLVISPGANLLRDYGQGNQIVFDIMVESSLGKSDTANFAFWINDKLIRESYSNIDQGKINYAWERGDSEIDSIMIQFRNDMANERGDRNLRLQYLLLNGQRITLKNSSFYLDSGRPFGKYRWNISATSYAELAAHYFINLGVDPDKIFPVTNNHSGMRRTQGNASSLRKFLIDSDKKIYGINVVSMDYHSRRTFLMYNRLLNEIAPVGVISSDNDQLEVSFYRRVAYIFKESLAMIYYMVFVFPFH